MAKIKCTLRCMMMHFVIVLWSGRCMVCVSGEEADLVFVLSLFDWPREDTITLIIWICRDMGENDPILADPVKKSPSIWSTKRCTVNSVLDWNFLEFGNTNWLYQINPLTAEGIDWKEVLALFRSGWVHAKMNDADLFIFSSPRKTDHALHFRADAPIVDIAYPQINLNLLISKNSK